MAGTVARSLRHAVECVPAYMQLCSQLHVRVEENSERTCLRSAAALPRSVPSCPSVVAGWVSGFTRAVLQDLFRGAGGCIPGFAALDSIPITDGIWLTSHQTYKPNVYKRKQCHGFLKRYVCICCISAESKGRNRIPDVHVCCRLASSGGRRTLHRRKVKKRARLSL